MVVIVECFNFWCDVFDFDLVICVCVFVLFCWGFGFLCFWGVCIFIRVGGMLTLVLCGELICGFWCMC